MGSGMVLEDLVVVVVVAGGEQLLGGILKLTDERDDGQILPQQLRLPPLS